MKGHDRILVSLFVVFLAADVASAEPSPGRTPEEELALIEKSSIAEEVDPIAPRSAGHLRLAKPTAGRLVRDGAGRPLGWLFGRSTLIYDIDPADVPVVAWNAANTKSFKPPKDGALEVDASWVLWLSPASVAGIATDPPREPVPLPFPELRASLDQKWCSPAIWLAEARMTADPVTGWVVARTSNDVFVDYVMDGNDRREMLVEARERDAIEVVAEFEGFLVPQLVDDRPVGRPRQSIDPWPAEVRKLDVTLVEQEGEVAKVSADVDYLFTRPVANVLRLHLQDRGVDATTKARVRKVENRLDAVRDSKGAALPFARRRNELLVTLPKAFAAGEIFPIHFEYLLPVLRRDGSQYWRLGAGEWFPSTGSWRRTYTSFHAVVKTPKPDLAFGTGREVRRWEEGELACLELDEKHPSSFPVLGAGRFFPRTSKDGKGRPITVASYAMERSSGQEKLGELFAKVLDAYEVLFPRYPSEQLAVVEAPSWGWGQAPMGYVNITSEFYNPIMTLRQRWGDSMHVNQVIAHELAHGWFGNSFRVLSDEDHWLEESFAQYCSGWLLDNLRDKKDLDRLVATWKNRAGWVKAPIPLVAADRISSASGSDHEEALRYQWALLYNKGPYVLHCLRTEIGDDAFFTVLRGFIRTFDGKPARTEDFIGLLSYVTKKDWHPWFAKYVYGGEMPSPKKG